MSKPMETRKVAVIGGGILGTLSALNIANLGIACDLYESHSKLWQGASFTGEGKIHLGYVYGKALDETLLSLLESAHSFAEDVEFAVGGKIPWGQLVSAPFHYGIPTTSSIDPEGFEIHAERIHKLARQVAYNTEFNYLDSSFGAGNALSVTRASASTFITPEKSVDTRQLLTIIEKALREHPLIRVCLASQVNSASTNKDHIALEFTHENITHTQDYNFAVNCAWDQAARLDQMATSRSSAGLNYRLRMFIHAQATKQSTAESLALTLTHGPFGDYVSFADGRTYASWYPSGLLGFSNDAQPPRSWAQKLSVEKSRKFIDDVTLNLSPWVSGIDALENVTAHARVVVAQGSTDIDDPASQLHQREGIRISNEQNWLSVQSFKFSTAPRAARLVQQKVKELLT